MLPQILRVIDTETTGLPPDAAMVEYGFSDVPLLDGIAIPPKDYSSGLVNPLRPIPPEVSAIHHIIDDDVSDAMTKEEAFRRLMGGADVFVAHNAEFDRQFFAGGDRPWICTLKCSRRVWPDAPSHGNQALRYWLKLPVDREIAAVAHRAGPDAYVTAFLLVALVEAGASIDEMVRWTKEPSLLPRVTFGKHKGAKWSDVPLDYLFWLRRQVDLDRDVKHTLGVELRERGEA